MKSKKAPRKAIMPKKRALQKASSGKALAKSAKTTAKSAKKRTGKKSTAGKSKPAGQESVAAKSVATPEKVRSKSQILRARRIPPADRGATSAGQSGDLQGLSNTEYADSESVDELLEEGNAFEADAVAGVEAAGNAEGSEVHTHEVPEDDVPEEYLDKD
ncbi:MAG TPA: hypothetical protein VIW68_00775 [Candidatus Sulfotelmatobacter sp.]